ncbi:MAG: hypothetical protein H7123_05280 [Thermoleophilia bacterium]|nr:hypothetical protein [Thermoleophilia bacterium]
MSDTPSTNSPDDSPSDVQLLAARIAEVSAQWNSAVTSGVAAGKRQGNLRAVQVAGLRDGLSLGVEGIREGWLIHSGVSRVLKDNVSGGLSLLVGDYCYAAGLCDIAAAGDLDAVSTLADLIATVAELALEAPRDGDAPDPGTLAWEAALAELGPKA